MEDIFKSLTKLIKSYDNFIIMSHQNMDLDALGSSLALSNIIKSFNKPNYIFMDRRPKNSSISKSLTKLKEESNDTNFIYRTNYNNILTDNTLLIILDVHKEEMIEYKKLIKEVKDVVVIDHHIKNNNYIKDTVLSYINSNVSSTIEIMVNYLKYLNKEVNSLYATIMLAGIEIDTNSFNIKTGENTYEAAAYLTKMGADNILKQELLKEDKQKYLERQEFIKNSYMINKKMALCIMDDNIHERQELAKISEELLQFDDVEASFTIGFVSEKQIGISARSIGKIDVEELMVKLGGGGHKTDAAAQFNDISLNEVKDKLIEIVKE